MRIKGWFIKVWRKLLIFFSAGAVITALAVLPIFADTASYANGQPFVSGEYFLNVVVNPATDNIKYNWTSNDTTGGTGTYSFSTVQNLNSSYPLLAGDYWKFTHTFADNHGYQISGTIRLPYSNLPYRDDVISYYLKFAMGFSTLSNLGSGWLNATLRFYNSSDTRLGEVYTMTKFASLASFAIQTQVPAFADQVAYMTLQFSGYGSSSAELYINELYFSSLVWSVYCDSPVLNVDYSDISDYLPDPTPPPDFIDVTNDLTDVMATAGPYDVQIHSLIADAASVDTSINASGISALQPALLAFKSGFDTWWFNNDNAFRRLVFFFVGVSALTSLAGIGISIYNRSKG